MSYELDTPIVAPNVNQYQKTTGYRFTCNNTSEQHPYDWYNAYIEFDIQVQKKVDGTGFVAADKISCVNSLVYSLCKQVKVNFNGTEMNDTPNINLCTHVKNLLEYSEPHNNILTNSFYYLDENKSTNVEYADFAAISAAGYKESAYKIRHDRIITLKSNNVLLSLNRYGFFQSLESQICPNSKVIVSIDFEESKKLLYSEGAVADGRVVITKMKLHVPKLIFNGAGEQLFLKEYLNPHEWVFLTERLEISPSSQLAAGTFLISSAITRPRHVFIWAINDANLSNQHANIFFHNTFSIANDKNLVSCQLEVGSGNYYPSEAFNPHEEISLAYRMLMSYNRSYNDYLTGSQLNLKLFTELYGMIYFDLRNQPSNLRSGTTKLRLKWKISAPTNAGFSWYALILSEETIKIVSKSGKVFLSK